MVEFGPLNNPNADPDCNVCGGSGQIQCEGDSIEHCQTSISCDCNKINQISRPGHYARGGIEPIDLIMSQEMGALQGNIIKYVSRYKHKDSMKDLKKAMQYLVWLMIQEMFAEKNLSWYPNKDFEDKKIEELAVGFIDTMQLAVDIRSKKDGEPF
jgi:hypothetical protein